MSEEKAPEEGVSVENASPDPEAEAESQESAAESTPAVSTDDEKTNPFQERIKELTDKVRSGKRQSEAQLFEARSEIKRLQKELDERPEIHESPKSLEDFEFDESKYRSYLDERAATIAEKVATKAVSKVQSATDTERVEREFRTRESAFESKVSDYEEVVYGEINGVRKWAASPQMADEIRLSDVGPELSYHLAKNPDTALEISNLSPRETIRRMTLLESSLKAEKTKTGKKVSDAPPPPPEIPSGAGKLDKEPTNYKEFVAMRRKQIAKGN